MISRSGCSIIQVFELNDDKTELLVHPNHRQMPPLLSVAVGNEMILPTECARNISVMFDHNLTMHGSTIYLDLQICLFSPM